MIPANPPTVRHIRGWAPPVSIALGARVAAFWGLVACALKRSRRSLSLAVAMQRKVCLVVDPERVVVVVELSAVGRSGGGGRLRRDDADDAGVGDLVPGGLGSMDEPGAAVDPERRADRWPMVGEADLTAPVVSVQNDLVERHGSRPPLWLFSVAV